ncbi:hypothetical protein AB6A23_12815 [Paenibacillus tarimensis]
MEKEGKNYVIFGIIIMAIGIFILYSNRQQEEELLIIKLFGYYILGIFYFSFNGIVLPLGFLISLFLRPRENNGIKRGASIFGLVMMIIGFIIR